MSYKNTVLNDYPNSFYLLDEVQSGSIDNYTELLSQFATYQALLDSGLKYGEINGMPVYDYSGSLNNGVVSFASLKQIMPLVSGGIRGTEITNSTEIAYNPKGIATKYYKDNSFSIEVWAALPAYNISTTIVGDININTGIFYQNGNIIFRVGSNITQHTVSNYESVHVVGIFTSGLLSLYINGSLVDSLSLDSYRFSNETVSFKTSPCTERLVIDSVGFYRYSLSPAQILNHYNEGRKEVNVSQIVDVDGGYLFSMSSESISTAFSYSYPVSKTWAEITNNGASISADNSYVYIEETATAGTASYVFNDFIIVPNYLGITTSQIYWKDETNGILVEASINNTNWQTCTNGGSLPYFNKNDNQVSDILYLRITLSSSDTSKYLPILRSLKIDFYQNKDLYSDNSGYYISSNYDYSLPESSKRAISYNKNNGLVMRNGHGFSLNGVPNSSSIEMIFTPAYSSNVLFSGTSSQYLWNSGGVITKSGIASIYVNGINRTSETNVWDFMMPGSPHHIVINLTAPQGSLKFNQNQNDSISGIGHMYKNLAVYQSALSVNSILTHYLLYTDNIINLINDTSFSIQESSLGQDSTPFFLTIVDPLSTSV